MSFAADILKRNRQNIQVARETVTSFTKACLIPDEKRDTVREALDGPPAVIRVDPAPALHPLNLTILYTN